MASVNTKNVILDTAERLFADRGFGGTALRHIIAEAGVNLAAVHYHFGSKAKLIRAVLARRLEPLNAERLRLLDACEAKAGKKLPLEEVLTALLAPALRVSRDPERGGPVFMRLMGRSFAEPDRQWQGILDELFGETVQRFTAALRRALPQLPPADFFWRIHFAIGALAHTMADTYRPKLLSGGLCDPDDVDSLITRLIVFVAAGMRAGGTVRPSSRTKK